MVQYGNTDYVLRNIQYNSHELSFYGNFPTYLEYLDNPVNPDNPDNPDSPIDTNVGVWKNKVIWFVDNNSEYGVLVNIYILFFISIICTSFIAFVKMIRKNRW